MSPPQPPPLPLGLPFHSYDAIARDAIVCDAIVCDGVWRPPSAKTFMLGGGSGPPSSKTFMLGGGSGPPSAKTFMLGGGSNDVLCCTPPQSEVRPPSYICYPP